MRQHTHQVPIKSADSILDEFLAASQLESTQITQTEPTQKSFLKRCSAPSSNQTATDLKVPLSAKNNNSFKSFNGNNQQRQQNLLFSIGRENSARDESCRHNTLANGGNSTSFDGATSQIAQLQRKLLGFFFIYATIIITLYLTYAIYSYYQQSQFRKQQQFVEATSLPTNPSGVGITPASSSAAGATNDERSYLEIMTASQSLMMKPVMMELQSKLEGKIHLLERYIEVLALDLEDTKSRLKERERCGCSIGCSFNGTRYSDGQRWQQKCDVCTCTAGKISCLPRECPKLAPDCDHPVQLPGRCCPTCMKKCKLNNNMVRHNQIVRLNDVGKQCKCLDGLIKCEPIKLQSPQLRGPPPPPPASSLPAAKNKTLEYIKSILSSSQIQQLHVGSGKQP